MNIEWQKLLQVDLGNDPFMLLTDKEEELHFYLSSVIRNIRTQSNTPSNEELSGLMNINEEELEKLDPAQVSIEVLLSYIHYLGGDLLLAIRHNDSIYQVTHHKDSIVVEVPKEVEIKALEYKLSINDYIKELMLKEEERQVHNKSLVIKYLNSFNDLDNKSFNELLNILHIRDSIKDIEKELDSDTKDLLIKGDKLFHSNTSYIYKKLEDDVNFSTYREERNITSSQWWWFLDVIQELGNSLTELKE